MWKKNFKPKPFSGSCERVFLTRVTDGRMSKIVPLPAETVYPKLPPSSNFTLDAQLKAGVVLKEENSLLIPPSESVVNEHLSNFMEDTQNE